MAGADPPDLKRAGRTSEAPIGAPQGGGTERTYRRTGGTRFLSLFCTLFFGGTTVSILTGHGPGWGAVLAGSLTVLSVASTVTAFADRFTISDSAIVYRNLLLEHAGVRPRTLCWTDVVHVREHRRMQFGRADSRPSAVFLVPRKGRRMVLDALQDFDEVLDAVRRHQPDSRHTGQ